MWLVWGPTPQSVTDRRTDRRMDRRMDGWTANLVLLLVCMNYSMPGLVTFLTFLRAQFVHFLYQQKIFWQRFEAIMKPAQQ